MNMKDVEERAKQVFKDHVAMVFEYGSDTTGEEKIKMLRWFKPGTRCHSITFIAYRNTLFIEGDYNCATYAWSEDITFKWVAECEFGYIHGKLQASPDGRVEGWDDELVKKCINEYFDERVDEEGGYQDAIDTLEEHRQECLDSTCTREDWSQFLASNGSEKLGEDYYDWAYQAGEAPHFYQMMHIVALRMAVKQLEDKKVAEKAVI